MQSKTRFYDRYHLQNKGYKQVIGRHNFTYFYILRFLHLADILPLPLPTKNVPRLKVLDVGCGVGTLATFLATEGAEVTGLDVSPRAIALANKAKKELQLDRVSFTQGELKKGRGQYDVVLCTEVIEHIPDDLAFLSLLASHLKPGGKLILTTPSSTNWLYKMGFYVSFDKRVGHLRRYTEAELMLLFRKTKLFSVRKVQPVEGPLRNILFTTKLGFLIKGIRGPLVPFFHWLDELSASIGGATDIQVLAVKRLVR